MDGNPVSTLARNREVARQPAFGRDVGETDRRHDADRDADQRRDQHHDDGADDRVAEAAAHLETGRRQLGEQLGAEAGAAVHDQHIEDRYQRHSGEQRDQPGSAGQHRAGDGARFAKRAVEAGARRSIGAGRTSPSGPSRYASRRQRQHEDAADIDEQRDGKQHERGIHQRLALDLGGFGEVATR